MHSVSRAQIQSVDMGVEMVEGYVDDLSWLPELLELRDFKGDVKTYLDTAYDLFAADFIRDEPRFSGKTVKSMRRVAYNGQDHSFWHCIEESGAGKKDEENRIPKISLVERIRWPRPVIEHAVSSPGVLAWAEIYRGRGTKKRVHLFVEDEDYCVVLDPRGRDGDGGPKYYILWTTFLCETEAQHDKMLRRYAKGVKIN